MAKPQKKKDSYHHGDLPKACVIEAMRLIAKQGIAALSLRAIARRLNVSHGAPYKHFANKEELLAKIATEGFAKFNKFLDRGRAEGGTDLKAQFKFMARGYLRFALAHPDHYRLMFATTTGVKHHDYESLAEAASGAFMRLITLVEDLQEANEIHKAPSEQISIFIWSTLHGFTSLWLDERFDIVEMKTSQIEPMFMSVVDQLAKGIAPPA